MTEKIKRLLKSKELIENKINLNNTLLETIKAFKQDETSLQEENKIYRAILSLIKKELRNEYR